MVWAPRTAQAGAMTTTPPEAPTGPPPDPTGAGGPRVTRDEVRDLGRLRRSITDRKVAGVAGGLGRHLDVDPLILRVAFVVLAFFGGAGLIVYGACWLLVPSDNEDEATIDLDERTRSIVLLIVGAVAVVALVGDSWGAFWFPWPLAIVALVALWILTRNSSRTPTPPYYYSPVAPTSSEPADPYDGSAYTVPAYTVPAYAAPPPYYSPPAPVPTRVPNPRRRGPILFWFTLALTALSIGVLGIIDVAGVDVPASAYPALVVAISGVMLLVGAFYGRAGGLILVGLVAAVGLAGATAVDQWDSDDVHATPQSAASVDNRYWLGAGEQVIDLSEVADRAALDGRRIEVEGGVGSIKVILPEGMGARVTADVDGPGHIDLFGEEHGGIDVSSGASIEGDPHITLDTQLGVGDIEVSYR